ncbi:MAG: hypothetical protein JJ975_03755 [Bacteroidia bacterium]|nr:hypothetical protein [Bacteroidia bacterium]
MIANWVHVMLVHVAVLGTPWLLFKVLRHRKAPMDSAPWKTTFMASIVLAVLTVASYFTGPEAAEWTKQVLANFPQDHVEDHALWGRVGMVIQGIAGLLGIMGWASIAQEEVPDRRISVILITLLIVNTLVLIYTAHLGGFIRRMDLAF